MLTVAVLILVALPVLYEGVHHCSANNSGVRERDDRAATMRLSVGNCPDVADVGNGSDPVG